MRALLTRRVDIAWLLLATALSGAALVLWLSVQAGATPQSSVYIVRAAPTTIAGQGGAPSGPSAHTLVATPTLDKATRAPTSTPIATAIFATPTRAVSLATPTIAPDQAAPAGPSPKLPTAGVLININTATAEELDTLPGIGPVLAKRIVEDREANGPYASVDELKRVKGIGDGIVTKVRGHATAGP